jgi:hypothetical protein
LIWVNGGVVVAAKFNQVLNERFEVLVVESFETSQVIYNSKREFSWYVPPEDDNCRAMSVNVGGEVNTRSREI